MTSLTMTAPTAPKVTNLKHSVGVSSRLAWIDIAKGIGILQVLWFHVAGGLQRAGIELPAQLEFLKSFTHSYNMSCFFFLSGLLAHKFLKKRPSDFGAELARGIVYPYLLWTTLQAFSNAALGSYVNKRVDITDVFSKIFIDPYSQYWFLSVLFLFYSLYYVAGRWRLGKVALLLMSLIVCFVPIETGISVLYPAQSYWLFYVLGAIAGPALLQTRWHASPFTAVVLLSVLLIFELCFAKGATLAVTFAFRILGTITLIAIAQAISLTGGGLWLQKCGKHSFEIFLAHVLPSAGIRIVLLRGLGVTSVPVHIVLGMAAGCLFPMALTHLAAKYHFSFIFRLAKLPRTADRSRAIESSEEIVSFLPSSMRPVDDLIGADLKLASAS